jgi:hypothetical protein
MSHLILTVDMMALDAFTTVVLATFLADCQENIPHRNLLQSLGHHGGERNRTPLRNALMKQVATCHGGSMRPHAITMPPECSQKDIYFSHGLRGNLTTPPPNNRLFDIE